MIKEAIAFGSGVSIGTYVASATKSSSMGLGFLALFSGTIAISIVEVHSKEGFKSSYKVVLKSIALLTATYYLFKSFQNGKLKGILPFQSLIDTVKIPDIVLVSKKAFTQINHLFTSTTNA